jgi:thiamine-phosphate pyrophosphorylase
VKNRFDLPITYLITRGEATPDNFDEKRKEILGLIRTAAECGITLVQIREKKLTAKLLYSLVSDGVEITRTFSTRLLVNERADIAVAARADGVHLTSRSIPAAIVRCIFGDELMIGVSTHSISDIDRAVSDGADLVVFGPIFITPGKGSPIGLHELSSVSRRFHPFPVLGLGGIDETNFSNVLDAGASGFAAIRYLNDYDNLRSIAELTNAR